jgi:hypothetical protein
MREAYNKEWHEGNDPRPGTSRLVQGESYQYPPGYSEFREHLWDSFQSIRPRHPSVEGPVFGNNPPLGCHMVNYSYFHKTPAVWDASARKVTS